jgi:hypothetical protein
MRLTCPPSAVLMVFVIRSGMDASRFAPMALSFMNPATMVRGAKLELHCALVSATPSHPSASINAHSSVAMPSVNTCHAIPAVSTPRSASRGRLPPFGARAPRNRGTGNSTTCMSAVTPPAQAPQQPLATHLRYGQIVVAGRVEEGLHALHQRVVTRGVMRYPVLERVVVHRRYVP